MRLLKKLLCIPVACVLITGCSDKIETDLDLSDAGILVASSLDPGVGATVREVLTEEIGKRSSLKLDGVEDWDHPAVIAVALSTDKQLQGQKIPFAGGQDLPEFKKEGYRVVHTTEKGRDVVWVLGADTRGIYYGIGKLLREAIMRQGKLMLPRGIDVASAPEYPLRGHQFGYRHTANSWDAWTVEQFEQHFREQVLFGANSFENIPFSEKSVHMKLSPQEMGVRMSEICDKYDADYWVWTPATFDLKNVRQREEALEAHEAFYREVPRLNGVFFPGGDPGHNHPSDVMPFLKALAGILEKYHPEAGVWISLQGFNREKVEYFFQYLEEKKPDWLRGVVHGPGSPPIDLERELLPPQYRHRSYADITHTVRCQYPAKNWDQSFALTLGREPVNPQPQHYARIYRQTAPYTDGFLTYSDGVHDDVNKMVWNQLGWDPSKDVHDILLEYGRFFFGADVAESVADGILMLEKNWEGPLADNPTIGKTLELWKKLEAAKPQLAKNWRWQQLVMRAYYDAYIQQRHIYEKRLEKEAYDLLARAENLGAGKAMEAALAHLEKARTEPVAQELRAKAVQYLDELFRSVGLQSSVPKYQARGYERGCMRDFIDHPLNNIWWLEDEFEKIRQMESAKEKLARLEFIRTYDQPGAGSFYDNISGTEAKHVVSETHDAIDYLWENDGKSRKRLSTQLFQFTPELVYEGLDSTARYLIRVAGYGEALLRANGRRLTPVKYEKGYEQFKEFPLPPGRIKEGKLTITFDKPDEDHLNWRQQSRVTDVWVLKQNGGLSIEKRTK